MINLYNVDCMEYMADKPDDYFELAITDPPYGIGEDGNKKRTNKARPCYELRKKENKYIGKSWDKRPDSNYFNELLRTSKNQIIWGANYFVDFLSVSMGWIFWDKKNEGTPFSDGELAFTSFNKGLKKFTMSSKAVTRGGRDRIHTTQKPVDLYRWLLKNYAKQGDKILDTHGGSMSIALACHEMGYDLDLCELDKDYFEAGKERLKQHTDQLLMV